MLQLSNPIVDCCRCDDREVLRARRESRKWIAEHVAGAVERKGDFVGWSGMQEEPDVVDEELTRPVAEKRGRIHSYSTILLTTR